MRMKFVLALSTIFWAVSPCHAQSSGPSAAGEDNQGKQFSFQGKEKFLFGNQHYRNTDTSIDVGLPYGFDFNADLTAFRSDSSSWTPTITFGAGKNWKQLSLSGTYAISPLTNDFRSNAVDLIASAHTDSEDFGTTVGGDVLVTHNISYLRFPAFTKEVDIDQRTPTITLKQQIYKTRLEGDFSEYSYSKDIPITVALLNKVPNRFASHTGSLAGVLQGFPDHSEKFGLYQDVEVLFAPMTIWATYESTHYIDTGLQFHATSDTFQYGADVDFLKMFTASLQYNHIRQTGQTPTDQYGAALAVRF